MESAHRDNRATERSMACNWGCLANLNPRTWNCTEKRVAQIAALVLLVCALALTACILIVQYPAASSAFITTFSILTVASLVTLIVALVKHYQNRPTIETELL